MEKEVRMKTQEVQRMEKRGTSRSIHKKIVDALCGEDNTAFYPRWKTHDNTYNEKDYEKMTTGEAERDAGRNYPKGRYPPVRGYYFLQRCFGG